MALVFGGNADFTITDTGAVVRDLSSYIQSVSGIPGEGAVEDVTTFGAPNQAKAYARTLNDCKATIKLFWDPTATTGPNAVLGPLRTYATPVAWTYGPQGTTTGSVKYSGVCFVTKFSITSDAQKMTTADLEIQTTGGVTEGTY